MQQTLLQLTGNSEKYNTLLNNARKIIYKNYPKTPLLKDDYYCSSAEPQVKTPELKSNWFDSLLKAFFNNFSPKTPLIKNDPYESGIDFDYVEKQIEAQDNVKVHQNKIPEIYDLYLDADKKMKKDGYEIVPSFVVSQTQSFDASFMPSEVSINVPNNKFLSDYNANADDMIDNLCTNQVKGCSEELKQRIKNLSPQDKAKFINIFNKYLIIHEMQHYKQFVTMLKVYGVEETKNIFIEANNNIYAEKIDLLYKNTCKSDPLPTMSMNEKLDKILQESKNQILQQMELLDIYCYILEDQQTEKEKQEQYKNLVNTIINKFGEIKDSKNVQDVQDGINDILAQLEALQGFKEDLDRIAFEEKIESFKLLFQEIKMQNMTVQEYFNNTVRKAISKKDLEFDEEQYQKVYNSVKDQPVTEEERRKAEIYKNAYLNYTSIDIDPNDYFSNPLEIEAYTVEAQAALEKLEEYNERHKGDKQ